MNYMDEIKNKSHQTTKSQEKTKNKKTYISGLIHKRKLTLYVV